MKTTHNRLKHVGKSATSEVLGLSKNQRAILAEFNDLYNQRRIDELSAFVSRNILNDQPDSANLQVKYVYTLSKRVQY